MTLSTLRATGCMMINIPMASKQSCVWHGLRQESTYRIELLSLDKQTYGYYRTLEDLLYTNPFFGSTPANPNNNLSNGALGYFGAYAVSSRTIVITDSLIKSVK